MVSSLDEGKWAVVWNRGLLHDTIATEPRKIHKVVEKMVFFDDARGPRTLFRSKIIAVFEDRAIAQEAIRKGIVVWEAQSVMVAYREKHLDEAREDRIQNAVRVITNLEF